MHICGFGTEVVHSNAYSLHVGIPLKKQIINFLKYAHSNSEFQPSMMRIPATILRCNKVLDKHMFDEFFGDITCLDLFPMNIMLSKFEDHAQFW